MERVFNFNAGPGTLPLPVLQEAQQEFLNYKGTGMSILESSHRAKEFEVVNAEAEANIKELLGLGDDYRVLFLQGGASTQFAMIPMNFLTPGSVADYVVTGAWSEKALKEAKLFGGTHVAYTSKESNHNHIPKLDSLKFSENPVYVHITSNNTIFGTEWQEFPTIGNSPLIADMSSDIFSKPFDANKFSLIYAGAQKNLGPAGVTVVIIRKEMIEKSRNDIATMLRYTTHSENDSLYNTPPTFSIYLVNLVTRWLKGLGGLEKMAVINKRKAGYVYDAIDGSGGFYKGHAEKDSRSLMNITFTLPNADLEKAFASQAQAQGMIGLKGHRSVGGLRASTYNALPEEGCKVLSDFMKEFQRNNG